ncbi:MAG: hypothetical protein M3R07_01220 [Gemmatimonadota bacterium]|nr:hypothetical protein [Gemmatimonadota bacterium]
MRDLPAKVVELVSRLLRGDRREWGAAMTAELAHLSDGPARWRFAVGCAWAALIAPAHPGAHTPGAAIRVTFVAGVVGCIAATAYVVTTWPHAAGEISGVTAAWFVAALAAYLWIALRPPNALVAHGDAARRGATVGIVLFLVGAIGRSVIDAFVPPDGDLAIGVFLTVSVGGTLLATAFVMSRTRQSFGAGVTASLWVALVCSMLAFNADLLAILSGFNLDAHMRHSMPDYYTVVTPYAFMSRHIGEHLATSMDGLRTLPLLALIIGSMGAALGRRRPVSRDTG